LWGPAGAKKDDGTDFFGSVDTFGYNKSKQHVKFEYECYNGKPYAFGNNQEGIEMMFTLNNW
jgi:hypothetical protein